MAKTTVNETKLLFNDLDKPSLHVLSYALRHPDTWPEGFVWNYKKCEQCAMGLAHQLWYSIRISTDPKEAVSYAARGFAMPYEEASLIFLGNEDGYRADWLPTKNKGHLWWKKQQVDFSAVTPEMVADQIDAYLATVE